MNFKGIESFRVLGGKLVIGVDSAFDMQLVAIVRWDSKFDFGNRGSKGNPVASIDVIMLIV